MGSRKILAAMSVLAGSVLLGSFVQPAQAGKACVGDCYVQARPPVVYRTFKRRVQLEGGVYEIAREPALYGWARRKVAVEREWHEIPAVYKTVSVTVRTPTRYVWEKRLIRGREVMCKVKVPGERVVTEKQVLVSPARRVAVGAPAYAYAERRILLRPYKNIAIYHPARHVYTTERVAIQPEGYVWRKASRSDLLWE
jgi:hypothetical protein